MCKEPEGHSLAVGDFAIFVRVPHFLHCKLSIMFSQLFFRLPVNRQTGKYRLLSCCRKTMFLFSVQ